MWSLFYLLPHHLLFFFSRSVSKVYLPFLSVLIFTFFCVKKYTFKPYFFLYILFINPFILRVANACIAHLCPKYQLISFIFYDYNMIISSYHNYKICHMVIIILLWASEDLYPTPPSLQGNQNQKSSSSRSSQYSRRRRKKRTL